MNKYLLISVLCVFLYSPSLAQMKLKVPFKIVFNSKYEIAGKKLAVKDLGFPEKWDRYNFLVLELRPSSPQRFQIGFNTNWGYDELRIMPYAVGAWARLAIPLRLYREKPRPSHDLASLNNIPGNMGWFNLGDAERGPLNGVDSISFRMYAPIGNPTIEIRAISLTEEDPGDEYFGTKPLIDKLGQWNLGDYQNKAHSLTELKMTWAKEEKTIKPGNFNYSKYGGYLNTQVKATGYFRTQKIDGKWWFVDPEGHLFLSVGADCISAGSGSQTKMVNYRKGVYEELPPKEIGSHSDNSSYGIWNQLRRYGDKWPEKSKEMVIKRMDAWGVNTIANWSDMNIIKMNQKPFMLQLRNLETNKGVMGLPNVYAPGFAENVEKSVKDQVESFKENPWLIGWFTGNEPAWIGQEIRLSNLVQELGDEYFKKAINDFLVQGDTPKRRDQFAYHTLRIFLETVDKALEKYDPKHLHIGSRFGGDKAPADEILDICKDVYDVYSFNSYSLTPKKEYMDYITNRIDLPMIIGEFHFGTTDRGMAQSLWQVDDQKERGVAYRYYAENGYSHPALVGTAYFQWGDQPNTGRPSDGENYNCGIVDVTDQPYTDQVEAMIETAKRLYKIHAGELKPVTKTPKRARGYGAIPDGLNW